MKLKFNLLLCFLFPLLVQARNTGIDYKKTINKEYTVSAGAVFNVANKYGKIVFHTWNKNTIKATIVITGFGKSDREAQETAESVKIQEDQSGNTVSLKSAYNPSGSGGSWFSWGGKRDSKEYVNIDYDVYLPQSLSKVSVLNQFGDVIADRFSFPAEMVLSYSTYDIREAEDLQLTVSYCDKGKIGKAGKVVMKSSYSNLRADQLGSLVTHSSYGNYTIGNVGTVEMSASYDDYKVDRLGSITGALAYTDLVTGELQQSIDLKATYGDVNIRKIGSGFKGADLQLSYADLKANVPSRLPMRIEVRLFHGDLHTGDLELKNVVSNKSVGGALSYTAQAGGGNEQSAVFRVKGSNCDVKLGTY
ncbi:MAG TPA: hypothetical protein VM802_20935 [Chitinophaga sp.]|uniref:hypothetical protein n=1 Tax=Chitinophaga sp. TaxID=1869181 RepID=UPI002CAC2796|nr:hypothetical protein [Chitinophaga sp.]HVI47357.1 hypothetical protein [Chitinophaga sp.]